MLNGKSILVTGGTGYFGKHVVRALLDQYPDIDRLVVYSRDDYKQYVMQQELPLQEYPSLQYTLGDIRDRDRLLRVFDGINIVIHAAAIKQVPSSEYNPYEAVKTNIIGSQNVIEAALERKVEKVVALSTDKAAAPVSIYGASKLASDKLFIAGNGAHTGFTKFSVIRYGNLMGSRGSVIPLYLHQKNSGVLTITHKDMTRFNSIVSDGVRFLFEILERMWGGEIFVPKTTSFRLHDVAAAICPECELKVIGIRPGEKLHEDMITENEGLLTYELNDYFVIFPSVRYSWDPEEFIKKHPDGRKCEPGFSYRSDTNTRWLSIPEIRSLIAEHVESEL